MGGVPSEFLDVLRCPVEGARLEPVTEALACTDGGHRYPVTASGIPSFAGEIRSEEARSQRDHYDRIAGVYLDNLSYPHTREYGRSLDEVLLAEAGPGDLGTVVELCCGSGEAFPLLGGRVRRGIGVDVSLAMLEAARRLHPVRDLLFLQADATRVPLAEGSCDHVVMLGGVHHVRDRAGLFAEIHRILRPGGRFLWREPVSDFLPWRILRGLIYRLSPTLDHRTERPLLYGETVPPLERAGLILETWRTCGFLGFCLLMNSDVLVVNRFLRHVPGIRGFARFMVEVDAMTIAMPGMARAGVQVVGAAVKPSEGPPPKGPLP